MNSNHYSCERPEHGWGTPPMLIKTFGVIIMRQPAKNKHQTSVCFSIESTGPFFAGNSAGDPSAALRMTRS